MKVEIELKRELRHTIIAAAYMGMSHYHLLLYAEQNAI
jgi:hypothetical protein